MERLLSDDEKIRRAEEIYYRRNNCDYNNEVNKNKTSLKDKFFLHLLIMINIAIIVFCVQNKDFIFTEQFLGKLNEYNISISSKITSYIKRVINDEESYTQNNEMNGNNIDNVDSNDIENGNKIDNLNSNDIENAKEDNKENNDNTNSDNNEINKNNDYSVTEFNSTGAYSNSEDISEINSDNKENNTLLSDADIDIHNLKTAYSFIDPIKGVVTSRFGVRNSENKNINGYHTGVDIASEKGTLIYASMQGIVDEVSSYGDYGNHVKIRCNNVTTLYAHCEKIFVTEGQIVAQGQTIGTVGSTGNSTGPHLHFEIRIDDRFINPEKILDIMI